MVGAAGEVESTKALWTLALEAQLRLDGQKKVESPELMDACVDVILILGRNHGDNAVPIPIRSCPDGMRGKGKAIVRRARVPPSASTPSGVPPRP